MPPETNASTGWLDEITILHLATQTAGFEKPGGYTKLLFEPGTKWHYSDGGPNWLAECVTLAYRRDLDELMFERVFRPWASATTIFAGARTSIAQRDRRHHAARVRLGHQRQRRRDGADRLSVFAKGRWKDQQILPREFVEPLRTTVPAVVGLPERSRRPRQRLGPLRPALVEQRRRHAAGSAARRLLVVGPVRQPDRRHPQPRSRRRPRRESLEAHSTNEHYDVLGPFLNPLVASQVPLADGPRDDPH